MLITAYQETQETILLIWELNVLHTLEMKKLKQTADLKLQNYENDKVNIQILICRKKFTHFPQNSNALKSVQRSLTRTTIATAF